MTNRPARAVPFVTVPPTKLSTHFLRRARVFAISQATASNRGPGYSRLAHKGPVMLAVSQAAR